MEPDGEHVPSLALTVENWRDGESIAERNARLRVRDAVTQADRPAGSERDPAWTPRPRRDELRGGRPAVVDVADEPVEYSADHSADEPSGP